MLQQLLAGGLVSLVNIAVHAVATAILVDNLHRHAWTGFPRRPRLELALVMVLAVSILMLSHCVEVGIWAFFYSLAGVTPGSGQSFYFAFVNYTTLGYGDIVPTEAWRLIGPMTAMNGVLLFGWSTAVIFAVLRYKMIELKFVEPQQ